MKDEHIFDVGTKIMQDFSEKYVKLLIGTKKPSKLLVAVSGGADSVYLLRKLHLWGFNIGIAHVNFQLRGKESDEDELFVSQLAAELNIPLFVKKTDTALYKKEHKLSTQETAREIRYNWFQTLLATEHYDFVLVGHHADDQVETLIINQIRGTGLFGLGGMRAINGSILRPMLGICSKAIKHEMGVNGWLFRHDSSNSSDAYLRNRIRKNILPALDEIDTDAVLKMANNTSKTQEHIESYKYLLGKEKEIICSTENSKLVISKDKLEKYPFPYIMLQHILSPNSFSYDQCIAIWGQRDATSGAKVTSIDGKWVLYRNRGNFTIIPSLIFTPKDLIINKHGSYSNKILKVTFKRFKGIPKPLNNELFLPIERFSYPFKLRCWQQGDRIKPFGMEGTKLLSNVLIDKKVEIQSKNNIWVLEHSYEILWVLGLKTSELTRHNMQSDSYLKISFSKLN